MVKNQGFLFPSRKQQRQADSRDGAFVTKSALWHKKQFKAEKNKQAKKTNRLVCLLFLWGRGFCHKKSPLSQEEPFATRRAFCHRKILLQQGLPIFIGVCLVIITLYKKYLK